MSITYLRIAHFITNTSSMKYDLLNSATDGAMPGYNNAPAYARCPANNMPYTPPQNKKCGCGGKAMSNDNMPLRQSHSNMQNWMPPVSRPGMPPAVQQPAPSYNSAMSASQNAASSNNSITTASAMQRLPQNVLPYNR